MDIKDMFRRPAVIEYVASEIEDADAVDLTTADVIDRTEAFLRGELQLAPPRRSCISKLGTQKKRTIYIFDDADRLVLKLLNYVLSRCDLGLSPDCLAFRPGFSAQSAFRRMSSKADAGNCCIRVDIKNYFNSIPLHPLCEMIREKLRLFPEAAAAIVSVIENPLVYDGDTLVRDEEKGAMAGMPLSPLLANLYLADFDPVASRLGTAYARYSDDVILFTEPDAADEVLIKLRDALREKGLVLNLEKTRISSPGEPWDFLGFSYCNGRIDLSGAAMQKMKGKISRSARRLYRWKVMKNATTERAVRAFIRKFSYKFFGSGGDDDELTWSRWYFPVLTTTKGLAAIDSYFQEWTRYLASGRHTKKNFHEVPYQTMQSLGYVPLVSAYYKRERDPARARHMRQAQSEPCRSASDN